MDPTEYLSLPFLSCIITVLKLPTGADTHGSTRGHTIQNTSYSAHGPSTLLPQTQFSVSLRALVENTKGNSFYPGHNSDRFLRTSPSGLPSLRNPTPARILPQTHQPSREVNGQCSANIVPEIPERKQKQRNKIPTQTRQTSKSAPRTIFIPNPVV